MKHAKAEVSFQTTHHKEISACKVFLFDVKHLDGLPMNFSCTQLLGVCAPKVAVSPNFYEDMASQRDDIDSMLACS